VRLSAQTAICEDETLVRSVLVHEFSHCFHSVHKTVREAETGRQTADINFDPHNAADDEKRLVDPLDWFGQKDAELFVRHDDARMNRMLEVFTSLKPFLPILKPDMHYFNPSLCVWPDVTARAREIEAMGLGRRRAGECIYSRPLRRTEPPAAFPYLGHRPVDGAFNAREALREIIERVEADFGVDSLNPLLGLIDNINQLGAVHTTHTAAFHVAPVAPRLTTNLVVMPRADHPQAISWWSEEQVNESVAKMVVNLCQSFPGYPPDGLNVAIGPIEILLDPGGARNLGCGLEFQVEASGKTSQETLEAWTWGINMLASYIAGQVSTF
jgi:hypothetical protein